MQRVRDQATAQREEEILCTVGSIPCLAVVVVTPLVYLSKLIELYTKKGEFTVCKFHLHKSDF